MGSAGPDLLFELVTTTSTAKYPKERAAKQLDDAAVRALATPALLIALELRGVLPCARKPLLARARDAGDARSLAYLKPLLAASREQYRKDPDAAKKLLRVGESPVPAGLDPAELAAWTLVGNALLNTDEAITRE